MDVKYPTICATITDSAFKNKFKDKFSSLQLETSLFESDDSSLEWDRQTVLSTFCHPEQPQNWEDILTSADLTFVRDLNLYGEENLIKIHLFLSSPFATHYERDIETTTISFVANIGGERTPLYIIQSKCQL